MTLAVADRLELTDLSHRYAAAVDERDASGVAALFTDDGVLTSPRPPHQLDPVEEAIGAAAITAALAPLTEIVVTQHAVVGLVLDEDAHGASGRVACVAHHVMADGTDLVWHLVYLDRYRRTEAGWRFSRRALRLDIVEQRPVAIARGLAPRR